MRALVRRVLSAEVKVANKRVGSIENGLLVYLAVSKEDTLADIDWIIGKILGLRIFEDKEGKMNIPINSTNGILLVSQFTLFGNVRKGNRPSFNGASDPVKGLEMYTSCLLELKKRFAGQVSEGSFGADMKVDAIDDGPVTIWIDSQNPKY